MTVFMDILRTFMPVHTLKLSRPNPKHLHSAANVSRKLKSPELRKKKMHIVNVKKAPHMTRVLLLYFMSLPPSFVTVAMALVSNSAALSDDFIVANFTHENRGSKGPN